MTIFAFLVNLFQFNYTLVIVLRQMIDKVIKVWFIGGAFEDMSDLAKICEVATSHPHL